MKDWAGIFESYLIPAMEADDISKEVSNEVRSSLGGAKPSTDNSPTGADDADDVEDLGKVDDIFGTEEAQQKQAADGPSGDPEQDQQDGAPAPAEGEDLGGENTDTGEADGGGDLEGGDDGGATDPNVEPGANDGSGEDTGLDDSVNPELAFAEKNRIRDNLVQLYAICSGDIETIVNSLNHVDNPITIQVLNAVLNHLRNCKDYTYKTLTQNLANLEYDELLQRYITLKRVYDICGEMLKEHFKSDGKKKVDVASHRHSTGNREPNKDRIEIFGANKNMGV